MPTYRLIMWTEIWMQKTHMFYSIILLQKLDFKLQNVVEIHSHMYFQCTHRWACRGVPGGGIAKAGGRQCV